MSEPRRLFLLLLPLVACITAHASSAGRATDAVRAILDRAMEIQARPELGGDAHRSERARLIRNLIRERFIISEMAQTALGDHREKLSKVQLEEFKGLFSTLFQDSYTRLVLNFLKRETIEYRGEEQKGDGIRVKTVILRANAHIPVDYFLVRREDTWWIRDVEIDQVSIVGNYRSAFDRVIKSRSFEYLLKRMQMQKQAIEQDASP